MKNNFMELLEDGTVSSVLQNIGKVATIFNPAIGGGLMLASNLTSKMETVDDDFLSDSVVGLNGTAMRLDKMIASQNVDFEQLKMLSENLKSISTFIGKTSKMLS